ncbi:MAG TPA: fatty acid--CoA ligase [Sphingopyxis sp.]|uniref:fatty acid--CoA ligase n=1 Tax=Sphingopyxis sp. TaxID=1908224 RepID=UPI002E360074|nr:fatty acid--CoA ligase [Sphingopyxis sp.]HEX2813569.1 fatty acid--CoA ligase [Sphingopyxis sp.]
MTQGVVSFARVADIARRGGRERPDKTLFHFEGRTVDYRTFDANSSHAANGLIALGLKPDERVAHIGKNSDLYFELLMAAAKAGGVMTPVNWRLALPEIAWIVADCGARILFVGPEFTDLVAANRDAFPGVEHVVAIEGAANDFADYRSWRDTFTDSDPDVSRGEPDAVIQMYTSGTTGKPKGAVLTNGSVLRSRLDRDPALLAEWERWEEDDVALVAMPCFHIGGTAYGISVMTNGATGVITREFDPAGVLDLIEAYHISKIFMVPAAMQTIVNQPRAREVDFSRLRHIAYGASPIPLALLRQCIDIFQCGFVQMYGMTETSGTIAALPPEDHDPAGNERMRSIGKPLRGVEMRVIGPEGHPLPPREIGEIAIRAQANMREYWGRPEATAETIDADGWLRTGDAGYTDEQGYFYLHDRVKDMIISGGENVYPAEVENAIYGHPAVADVAVVGVPDARWGEAVKACVVLKPGAIAEAAEIIGWARDRIAGYKCPKSVDFIAALPRNPSGKILRRELRAPYWEGRERPIG